MNNRRSKQEAWTAMESQARSVTDKLGMPIDEGILEAVVVLRLLGFNTTVSCEGHVNRITGGPYVTFESEEALRYADQANQVDRTHRENKEGYSRLRNLAIHHSILQVQKLTPYLDKFYTKRETPFANRLIIRVFPMTYNCLKCQGAELAYVGDLAKKRDILLKNQLEMQAFTDFLKTEYFSNDDIEI
jgi:hypothetical protein